MMNEVDNREGLDGELKKNSRVLVLFYASWCPYCRSFVPVFKEETANFKLGVILQVLLDDYDNPLWDDYDIGAVPTVIFFEKSKVTKRLDGEFGVGLKASQLVQWLKDSNLL